MKSNKDYSLLNCLATALIAYFITVPGHELIHLLTDLAYGGRLHFYSAGAVDAASSFEGLSAFHTITLAGGNASIINALIGIVLAVILVKMKLKPTSRLFLTQLMGMQFVQGIGYIMVGGLFGAGDWGNVFRRLDGVYPELIGPLRITLSVIGCVGIVALFFFLNYLSYYFISDKDNKKERIHVALGLHLIPLIAGFAVGMIISAISPAVKAGWLTMGECLLFQFMWIPFFWGFMFTGVMNVLPPKESRFLYKLPQKPNWLFFAFGLILVLIDIFIFGPGVFFN